MKRRVLACLIWLTAVEANADTGGEVCHPSETTAHVLALELENLEIRGEVVEAKGVILHLTNELIKVTDLLIEVCATGANHPVCQ